MSADGSIVIKSNIDNTQAEKELNRLIKKIENIEREISGKQAERSKLVQTAEELGVQLDSAKAKLHEMQTAAKGAFSAEQIGMQKETVNSLQARWNAAQSKVEQYDLQIQRASTKLKENKDLAAKLADEIARANKNQNMLGGALESTSKRFKKLLSRVSRLASRVFLFSVITRGLRSVRNWMGNVIKSNDEASAALARLKGALLTMAQPIVDVVIPAFTMIFNILTAVIGKIAAFLSAIGGKTVQESADAAEALNNQVNAIENVGSAAKKASKSLAGFDEINKISSETEGSGTSGSGTTDIKPDFSWADGISETLDKIADYVIMIGIGFALWKIGSILPKTLGTISKTLGGIIMFIGGLLLLWNGITDAWENGINWGNLIEMIAGLAAAAGGLYIAFGPVASGIMLIVGGLALLVTGFHDAMESGFNLQNTLLSIAGIIATGLGISLLAGSFIPLIIAAIASLILAMTVATGHGEELIDGIRETCQGFVDFFKGIFSGDIEKSIGGIEKIFSGLKKTILSIFSGIRDTILSFLDWLDKKTGGKLAPIINFVKSLVVGFFGLLEKTASGAIDGLKQIFSGIVKFISGVFTGDWEKAWEGVKDIFKGIFNTVISILEGAVNLIINGLNWLIKQMNKISFEVPDWVPGVGGKTIGINIPKIGEISLPRLAQGAVIPPNREFMAVLGDQKHGTNIEAPLSTIQEAVALVMNDMAGGMMAGFEALLEENRRLRAVVEGIEVGDSTIGQAAARYNSRMAIIKGGL